MTYEEEEKFKKAVGFRQVERCCGTCWWFDRSYENAGCRHPKQAEFDALEQEYRRNDPDHIPEPYGAYGGAETDEGHVCDLWEKSKVGGRQ